MSFVCVKRKNAPVPSKHISVRKVIAHPVTFLVGSRFSREAAFYSVDRGSGTGTATAEYGGTTEGENEGPQGAGAACNWEEVVVDMSALAAGAKYSWR